MTFGGRSDEFDGEGRQDEKDGRKYECDEPRHIRLPSWVGNPFGLLVWTLYGSLPAMRALVEVFIAHGDNLANNNPFGYTKSTRSFCMRM